MGPLSRSALAVWWIVLIAAVAAALTVGAQRPSGHPSLAQRTAQVASAIRCPVCDGLSVEDSTSPIARNIKAEIRRDLDNGETQAQVEASLVSRYGESILLVPPRRGGTLWIWILPLVAVAGGIAGMGNLAWRRSKARNFRRPEATAEGSTASNRGPYDADTQRHSARRRRPAVRRKALLLIGAAFMAAGAAVLSVSLASRSSASRLPGDALSGSLRLSNAAEVSRALRQAQTFETKGQLAQALALYDRILAAHPGEPEALAYSGWILDMVGRPGGGSANLKAEALKREAAAVAAAPSYADAHYFLGVIESRDYHRYDQAVSEFADFLADRPSPQFVTAVASTIADTYRHDGKTVPPGLAQ